MALVNEAAANGARKVKACEMLEISLRTFQRWTKPSGIRDKRNEANRTAPSHQLTQAEKALILRTANRQEYRDLPPSKIVPLLADEGRYIASESSFYRVLREHKQLTARGRSKPKTHTKPRACRATGPNQVWSWDISYLPLQIRGMYVYLYMVIDIFSRKIVGWHVHENESANYASNLIRQACSDENVLREQLTLHSDNGKPMKGATMLSTLQELGVVPSFSRPSVSDDNPFSESAFRTLKYHHAYPYKARFEDILDARSWVFKFVEWYNHQHLHSAIKFVTPAQRHNGNATQILVQRDAVYKKAKALNPSRWSGNTRNWALEDYVTLNPDRKRRESLKKDETLIAA